MLFDESDGCPDLRECEEILVVFQACRKLIGKETDELKIFSGIANFHLGEFENCVQVLSDVSDKWIIAMDYLGRASMTLGDNDTAKRAFTAIPMVERTIDIEEALKLL